MIRPLRVGHRLVFLLLALVVPFAFALALAGRMEPAKQSELPFELRSAHEEELEPAEPERTFVWSPYSLLTSVRSTRDGGRVVRVHSWKEPTAPDLLLYWSATPPDGDSLALDARLLGSVGPAGSAPRDFRLDGPIRGGWLVLYSLGHSEVAGALALGD